MANCKENCIHCNVCPLADNGEYIDEDCLSADCPDYLNKNVVPKSEVDRLVDKWIGEENLTQDAMTLRLIEALRDEAKRYEKYYFNHEYDKLIADAKQEVAREIFEEIEKHLVFYPRCREYSIDELDYEKIKNKYTESEDKE